MSHKTSIVQRTADGSYAKRVISIQNIANYLFEFLLPYQKSRKFRTQNLKRFRTEHLESFRTEIHEITREIDENLIPVEY